MGPRDPIQVRLEGKHLYLLSHLCNTGNLSTSFIIVVVVVVWRSEVNVRAPPLSLSTLFFEAESLAEPVIDSVVLASQ